jgi:hypothetical protein
LGRNESDCENDSQGGALGWVNQGPSARKMTTMKKILSIAKWLLIVWGAISLVVVFVIGGFIAYKVGPGNQDKTDLASPDDVRFVLNWPNLRDNRIEKVIHSYVSARSLLGDHIDAYAIKIKHVSLEELTSSTDDLTGRWYRGDQLPKTLDDAVSFVGSLLKSDRLFWFPKETELRSSEVYIFLCSVYCHGIRPSAAEMIFVRPKDNMVFYFGGTT